jgi:hypothetical protein
MASNTMSDLENIWDALLSRNELRIRSAYESLLVDEQKAVLIHLRSMAVEPGWQNEQRISAQAALKTLAGGSEQV